MVSHRLPGAEKGWVPDGRLAELLHLEASEEELMRCRKLCFNTKQSEMIGQARKICGVPTNDSITVSRETLVNSERGERTPSEDRSYKKILAILVLINRTVRIKSFLQAGICDKDLPLVPAEKMNNASSGPLQPNNAKIHSPKCLKGWRRVTFEKFLKWQWPSQLGLARQASQRSPDEPGIAWPARKARNHLQSYYTGSNPTGASSHPPWLIFFRHANPEAENYPK